MLKELFDLVRGAVLLTHDVEENRREISCQDSLHERHYIAGKTMKKEQARNKRTDYPDKTLGTKLAAEARKLANSLTDEERAKCLAGAKALIYGTKTKEVAGA